MKTGEDNVTSGFGRKTLTDYIYQLLPLTSTNSSEKNKSRGQEIILVDQTHIIC